MEGSLSQDFKRIIEEYGGLLGRVAASYEANHHLRQELLQEISLAVWQALGRFKGESSTKTYILRVAHNRAVTHVAYQAKLPKNDSYCEVEAPKASLSADTEEQHQQRKHLSILLSEIRKLPIQTRQVVTLSMEGLSYGEISNVCGITASNVGVILTRSKRALAEVIQDVR